MGNGNVKEQPETVRSVRSVRNTSIKATSVIGENDNGSSNAKHSVAPDLLHAELDAQQSHMTMQQSQPSVWKGIKVALKLKKASIVDAVCNHEVVSHEGIKKKDLTIITSDDIAVANDMKDTLNKEIATSPNAMLHFSNGLLAIGLGSLTTACEHFEQAIKLDGKLGSAYTYLVHSLLEMSKSSQTMKICIPHLEIALKYDKEAYDENLILLAQLHALLGNLETSISYFNQIDHKNKHEDLETIYFKARNYWHLGSIEKSQELMNQLPDLSEPMRSDLLPLRMLQIDYPTKMA